MRFTQYYGDQTKAIDEILSLQSQDKFNHYLGLNSVLDSKLQACIPSKAYVTDTSGNQYNFVTYNWMVSQLEEIMPSLDIFCEEFFKDFNPVDECVAIRKPLTVTRCNIKGRYEIYARLVKIPRDKINDIIKQINVDIKERHKEAQ